MVLPAPAAVPPIVLLEEPPSIWMPLPLPSGIRAGDVGADQVAFDQCAGRVRVKPDARGGIGRDDVPVAGRRAADRDARGAAHEHAEGAVPQGRGAGEVGADAVATGSRRPSSAVPAIDTPARALAEITLPAPCAAPPMVTPDGIVERHARAGVGQRLGSGLVRADVVALDHACSSRRRRCRCRRRYSPRSRCRPDRAGAADGGTCPARDDDAGGQVADRGRALVRRCRSGCPPRRSPSWTSPVIRTPSAFPEMKLRPPATGPPMVLDTEPLSISTPAPRLPRASVPVWSSPIRLPWIEGAG